MKEYNSSDENRSRPRKNSEAVELSQSQSHGQSHSPSKKSESFERTEKLSEGQATRYKQNTDNLADRHAPAIGSMRLQPGAVIIDRYTIVEEIGKGGMGEVYHAQDERLKKPVALKFLLQNQARNHTMVERFRREVNIAHNITHRNVCRVYDIGDMDGHPFISMQYVDGENLLELLKREGPLPREESFDIARQLCEGLEALHAERILHRDLKPANIMIEKNGKLLITDFGLSGLIAEISNELTTIGTLTYMAPEHLTGEDMSPRSDLYSLGLILYEIFTGEPAFHLDTEIGRHVDMERRVQQMLLQHRSGPRRPLVLRAEVTPEIDEIIMRCLELDPQGRPASASEVISSLEGKGSKINPFQPFIYGQIVRGSAFLGMEAEFETILNRVLMGESTVVVGCLKSGKSSLLQKMEDELRATSERLTVHRMDLRSIPSNFTPANFWEECLDPLRKYPGNPETLEVLKLTRGENYERRWLLRLFDHLKEEHWKLVLLLDEFELLFSHPGFLSESNFFALLRQLAMTSNSLTLVPASRISVTKLNKKHIHVWDVKASPYFNFMIDVYLRPYGDDVVDQLLGRVEFSTKERLFIRSLAGHHPYLLSAVAATLFEERQNDYGCIVRSFYDRIAFFFDELWEWEELTDRCRSVALILCLAGWAGRCRGSIFSVQEIGNVGRIDLELQQLNRLGLVEQVSGSGIQCRHCVSWKSQKWMVGSSIFLCWMLDALIVMERISPALSRWLDDKGYGSILNEEEWGKLLELVRKSTKWEEQCVEMVAQSILEDFFSGNKPWEL